MQNDENDIIFDADLKNKNDDSAADPVFVYASEIIAKHGHDVAIVCAMLSTHYVNHKEEHGEDEKLLFTILACYSVLDVLRHGEDEKSMVAVPPKGHILHEMVLAYIAHHNID